MRTSNRIYLWLWFLLLSFACLQRPCYAHERLLLKHAVRRGPAGDWRVNEGFGYAWLTNRSLLYWKEERRKEPLLEGGTAYFLYAVLYRYDVVSSAKKRLYSRLSGNSGPWLPVVSGDGKRLFWLYSEAQRNFISTSRIEQCISLPKDARSKIYGPNVVTWLPDNRHWLMFVWDKGGGKFEMGKIGPQRALLGSVSKPISIQSHPIAKKSPLYRLAWSAHNTLALSQYRILVSDLEERQAPIRKVTFYELALHRQFMPVRRYHILLPSGLKIDKENGLLFSPNRRYIAWLFTGHSAYHLWVSRLDGSHMRSLGSIRTQNGEFPVSVKWLPDGKWLSFKYKEALWRVAAG